MAEGLVEMVRALRAALVRFEPEGCSGEECAALVEELATTEKVSAAARVRAAARAGTSGAHRERGFADVADWLARASGTSTGTAKAALDTAAAVEQQPDVKAALTSGELSLAQARELVRTEAVSPGSAVGLLEIATGQSLKTLKEEALQRRTRAVTPEELHARQQEARVFRHWRTSLGMIAFAGEVPPEVGVPVMNRLEAETDRLWQEARQQVNLKLNSDPGSDGAGRIGERRAAIAADAFVRLWATGGKGKSRSADLVIVCDLQAYRRGHAHDGEPCHIVGGGPIPVSVARRLGHDAFLKAVLHDGVKIDTIAHFGRKVTAALRTALELGAPALPSSSGRHPLSTASPAPLLAATAATTSSATTSTPSPTAPRPPTPTSNHCAGHTTNARPKPTAKPAYSAGTQAADRTPVPVEAAPTRPDRPPADEQA